MILESPRLTLRPLRRSDADALHVLHTDPLVVQLTTDGEAMTRAQSDERLELYLHEWRLLGFGFFAVYERQAGGDLLFAGRCGLRTYKREGLELGYCFSERASGRGLATESAELVLRAAFQRLLCDLVYGLVRPTNNPSKRVLHKLGFSAVDTTHYRGTQYIRFERKSLPE